MKRCTKCKFEKSEKDFGKDKWAKDGLRSWCKSCKKEADRVYEQKKARKESRNQRNKKYFQTKVGKEVRKKADARYQKANPEKVKARSAVAYALKTGRLFKQPCHCSKTKAGAHHEDYSKPLNVIWLCPKHHAELKKSNKKSSDRSD